MLLRNLLRLYYQFWNTFCSAYPSGEVPTAASFPYISYPTPRPKWGGRTIDNVILYDQSTSFNRIGEILESIEKTIAEPGMVLTLDDGGGSIRLYRPNGNFFQKYSLPADEAAQNIKAYVITIEYLGHIL